MNLNWIQKKKKCWNDELLIFWVAHIVVQWNINQKETQIELDEFVSLNMESDVMCRYESP